VEVFVTGAEDSGGGSSFLTVAFEGRRVVRGGGYMWRITSDGQIS